ncbi:TolC family protein [Chryseosolibacter indicus]|uniref:TolC family protein n=1 Tax=Chryseosolibacter indicus TaxID=2782351 RepID=A0ABS5VXA8_9BACT|nr:TolC family protein [Chryseosolibacter indicus]MBT1705524.1 TolC family protein [Chryseosolibacter indicus]
MKKWIIPFLLIMGIIDSYGQETLSLKDALEKGLVNYGSVKAKGYNVEASKASLQQSRRDYLPNLVVSAQQDYGTINGQNGPLYGFGGYSVASSGLPLSEQNWNAAFGALYLANVNWEVFTFGRTKERINVSKAGLEVSKHDLAQEQFQHQVRIAAAYLNVLAAQRLAKAQQNNFERAEVFKRTVVVRAKNGLIAGVDSSLANAEVSNAKIAYIKAKDFEQEEAKKLSVLIGESGAEFLLDTSFVKRIPNTDATGIVQQSHPTLTFLKSRVDLSMHQAKLIRRGAYPSFSLFGVIQKRGSGFDASYATDQSAYTTNYVDGIKPTRTNYLIGAGFVWNITSLTRTHAQARAQNNITLSNQSEYELADQQLKAQYLIAETKFGNALQTYYEAPIQVKSASDAYAQRTALYNNGLTTIVEVTQTLYALNRAETDRDIAYINVWQALLLKAAASGNLELFIDEL